MKKLILFILLFATSYTYAQVKVGSEGGIIATGIYPVAKSNDIKSGVHTVQSIIERNSIPDNFRTVGMLAYVIDSLKYYQLKTGITNSDWYEFKGTGDTTLVELPLYVDTAGGVRTLKILHANGLVSGGIVTKGINDWAVDVTSAVYYINNKAYTSSSSTVTVDTSDATYDRIDVISVDTTGNVIVISGTPSANPIAPQVNTASQLALTTITVKASSTSTSVTTKIIYDEGNEWDTATSGTITAHFLNEDNPYHSAYDIYVPTYENGGTLEFTDSDGDTVTSSMVLKYFLYLNGIVDRTFQVQFFNDDNPVSNSLSFSSGFGLDPNNVSVYQNISIPLSSFTFSSSYFNKLKISMAGEDVSGANGYYLDNIQLQSGINYVQTDYSRAYVDFEISSDSTKLYAIRFNGGVDTLDWVGGGGSGGVTPEQISDSLGNITLQRAYNNAPTAVPQISGNFPFIIKQSVINSSSGQFLLIPGGFALDGYDSILNIFTRISNGGISNGFPDDDSARAVRLGAVRYGDETLPGHSMYLGVSPDYIIMRNGANDTIPTKIVLQNLPTSSTADSIIGISADTLIKIPVPGGGSISVSGTYTPVSSSSVGVVTNIAGFQYMRIDSIVTVSGHLEILTSSAGIVNVSIDPPIPTNFSSYTDAHGFAYGNYPGVTMTGSISADNSTDKLVLGYTVASGSHSSSFEIICTYIIR